jgi:hypothetical protein
MAKTRPTIASLYTFPGIAVEAVGRLERDVIRLIQLQDEQRTLEAEEGYTDRATGERHPGVRDRIEQALIGLSLFDGVEIEDYTIFLSSGKGPDRIDRLELLRLGVSDDIIKQATVSGKAWQSVTCRKKGAARHADDRRGIYRIGE